MARSVAEVVESLIRSGRVRAEELSGCSESEVASLERDFGFRLPARYREFLLAMGHDAGPLLRGSRVSYKDLPRLRESFQELLEEDGSTFPIPREAFVFYMHQGYDFLYFLASGGDDPPVYQYVEGDGQPELQWASFTDFLAEVSDRI